jgi:hypothetical protein
VSGAGVSCGGLTTIQLPVKATAAAFGHARCIVLMCVFPGSVGCDLDPKLIGAHPLLLLVCSQGVANDYCRFVPKSSPANETWFTCALAGSDQDTTPPGQYNLNTTSQQPCVRKCLGVTGLMSDCEVINVVQLHQWKDMGW